MTIEKLTIEEVFADKQAYERVECRIYRVSFALLRSRLHVENSLAARAQMKLFISINFVPQLRWQIHVAALTDAGGDFHHGGIWIARLGGDGRLASLSHHPFALRDAPLGAPHAHGGAGHPHGG